MKGSKMKKISEMDIPFDLNVAEDATICTNCGKSLGEGAILYINGEGFCSPLCEKIYNNKMRFGSEIDSCIENIIPPIYQNTDIDKLPQINRQKIDEILQWKYNPKGIFIWGDSGSGKTRTLLKLIKMLVEGTLLGIGSSYISSNASGDLKAKFEDCYNKRKQGEFFNWNANASLLYIDDFGKGKFTEAYEGFIFNLIEHRTSHQLPTFISTNLAGEALKAKFSSEEVFIPFARRIREFFKTYKFLNQ